MGKLKKASIYGGVLIGTTLCSLAVSTFFLQNSGDGQTFDLSRLAPLVSEEKTRVNYSMKTLGLSKIELENQVKPFENYIINWVATYTGRKRFPRSEYKEFEV